jgi:hypothetical protein
MAEIHTLDPIFKWPILTVLESGNDFNKGRGKFFYLDRDERVHGPFMSKCIAQLDLLHQSCDPAIPMRKPFQQDGVWWWKKDTPDGPAIEGPYVWESEAHSGIRRHVQDLNERAHNERRN